MPPIKGDISSDLHDFILLVEGQGPEDESNRSRNRRTHRIMRCGRYLAFNGIKKINDLVGLTFKDLTLDTWEAGFSLGEHEKPLVRKCIDKANKEFVSTLAIASAQMKAAKQQQHDIIQACGHHLRVCTQIAEDAYREGRDKRLAVRYDELIKKSWAERVEQGVFT